MPRRQTSNKHTHPHTHIYVLFPKGFTRLSDCTWSSGCSTSQLYQVIQSCWDVPVTSCILVDWCHMFLCFCVWIEPNHETRSRDKKNCKCPNMSRLVSNEAGLLSNLLPKSTWETNCVKRSLYFQHFTSMQAKPPFPPLTLLDVMSVLVTGMLMTNEVIRVSRMVPMSHMKPFIRAYGAIYMEQVAGQRRPRSLTRKLMRAHVHSVSLSQPSVNLRPQIKH